MPHPKDVALGETEVAPTPCGLWSPATNADHQVSLTQGSVTDGWAGKGALRVPGEGGLMQAGAVGQVAVGHKFSPGN